MHATDGVGKQKFLSISGEPAGFTLNNAIKASLMKRNGLELCEDALCMGVWQNAHSAHRPSRHEVHSKDSLLGTSGDFFQLHTHPHAHTHVPHAKTLH